METKTLTQKQELIDWITTINDIQVIENLNELKKQATFNFDEEFKKGYTSDEARKISKEKIREWWGK